jgi:elongation factor Ts
VAEISAGSVKELRDQTGAGMMDCKRALSDAGGDVKRALELLRERGLAKAGRREGRATSEGAIAFAIEGRAGGLVELGCETDFVARTELFTGLARSLAETVARDAALSSPQALLQARLGGEEVSERIRAAIATLGENVQVKRVARLFVESGLVRGYLHAGGKLGVLVSLSTSASGPEIERLARDVAMHVAAHDPSPVAVDQGGVPAALLEAERAIYRKQAEQTGKPAAVLDRIVEGKVSKFVSEVCLLEQAFVKDPDKSVGDLLKEASRRAGAPLRVVAFQRFKLGEAAGP